MVNLRVMGVVVLLPAVLIAVGMACGGGEGDESTPAATPSLIPAGVKERLERMVLQPDDVPAGFILIDQVFSSNEQVAAESVDPQAELARLQRWGRIWGHEVTYEPGGTPSATPGGTPAASQTIVFSVNSAVSLYESAEGASASWAEAAQAARTTDWPSLFQGVTDIEVEELPASSLADEALWMHVAGRAEAGAQTFAHDVVLLRQGASRGTLQVGSFGTEAGKQLVEQLARTQAEHMASALP